MTAIVQFKRGVSEPAARRLVVRRDAKVTSRLGLIHGFALRLPAHAAARLAQDRGVALNGRRAGQLNRARSDHRAAVRRPVQDQRVIGTVMLANRFGLGRGFTEDDRALFDTLAANASSALQYDRLEQAVGELRELQDQLQHQPRTTR